MPRHSWCGRPGPTPDLLKRWYGPNGPRVLLTTITLEDIGGRTKLRLTWVPHEASEAEIVCFAAAIDGMGQGWNAGMELLAKLLVELQT